LILRKIIKIVATTSHILGLKCTKFDVGLGSPRLPNWIEGVLFPRNGRKGKGRVKKGEGGKGGRNGRGEVASWL